MSEKISLITASSKGLGRDMALRLADCSAGLIVHYHKDREAAAEVVREIQEKGKQAAAFSADLTLENEARSLVARAEKKFGKIDILVNNFGPIVVKPWEEATPAEWLKSWRTNFESALFCMRAVLPGMRQRRWGRIINLGYSRVEQLAAFPTIAPYAVSKAGLLILTRTASYTEARFGITVNMVSPGLMEKGVLPADRKIPRERLGRFTDVSEAVLFLASEKADYITGTNLVVAGGWKI